MTTKEFFKNNWNTIVSLLIGFAIGILINLPTCRKIESKIEYIEKHDTVTITKDSIVYKTKPVNVYHIDTFYVKESGDTVKLDSIPITEYQYKDTIKTDSTSTEVMINYHGFNAGIDSLLFIHNYYERKETIIQPPKKVGWVWYIGIDAGIGGQLDMTTKQFGWGPLIGIHGGIGIGGTIK